MNHCIDCKHHRHTSSWLARQLGVDSTFELKCAHPQFLDPADKSMVACKTLRVMQCNGQAPLFVRSDKP